MKYRSDESVWSLTIPVLSTAHIDAATNTLLIDHAARGQGGDLPLLDVVAVPHGGFFLHFHSEADDAAAGLPKPLQDIAQWARIRDVQWVRLDGEIGDTTKYLPEYDW